MLGGSEVHPATPEASDPHRHLVFVLGCFAFKIILDMLKCGHLIKLIHVKGARLLIMLDLLQSLLTQLMLHFVDGLAILVSHEIVPNVVAPASRVHR